MLRLTITFIFIVSATVIHGQNLFEGKKALIQLSDDEINGDQNIAQVKEIVRKEGGQIIHVFHPDILKGYVTETALKQIKALPFFRSVHFAEIDPTALGTESTDQMIAMAWNQNLSGEFALRAIGVNGEHFEDARTASDMKEANTRFALRGQNNYYQTSEYLMGEVAVGVVFVESDGSLDPKTETWDQEEMEDAFGQIEKGLEWWSENGGYPASLTWTYDLNFVKTKFEPISRSVGQANLWAEDVLGKLGYNDAEDVVLARQFDNDLRDRYKTDWAITLFMVDASEDEDGKFVGETGIAWAFLGGPYLIASNKCDGWGLDNVWLVVAHETGHLFNALDEYEGSSSPSASSGRLNVINGNHELGGGTAECMMKSNKTLLCEFTLGQIGWADNDKDGFFDADYLGIAKRFNTGMVKKSYDKFFASLDSDKEPIDNSAEKIDENPVLFFDDFTEKRGWHQDESSYYSEGKYHVYDRDFGITSWLDTPYDDFAVAVKTNWLGGEDEAGYGLMFRASDINNGYLFLIGGDGSYCLGSFDYGNWTYLVDWQESDAVNKKGQNFLKVRCTSEEISLYVNGVFLKSVKNRRHEKGVVGITVYPAVHIAFDEFLVTRPE